MRAVTRLDKSSVMQHLHQLFTEPRDDGAIYPPLDDSPFLGVCLHRAMLENA